MTQVTLTRERSREIDALAINRYGIPGLVLMENAGRGVVDVLLSIDPVLIENPQHSVTVLCGKGNNAGDGFVIARHLEIRGVHTKVILLADPVELRGDAQTNFEILCHTNVPMIDLSKSKNIGIQLTAESVNSAWLIDALLGTGAQGEPREPFASAIRWMNDQSGKRLAVDIPSGLDCDSGKPSSTTVRADHTCTFVAVKQGFSVESAQSCLGSLHVVSIGIPPKLIDEISGLPQS